MSDAFDFASVGGIPFVQTGCDPGDPANIAWNFGVLLPTDASRADAAARPYLYDRFPNLRGAWDGKAQVNHHEAVRKVLGSDLRAQMQPRGTCGGRAGSRGLELLQCVLMASGKRAKFHYVSHAWLYYLARKKYGMLRGGDGVAGGSIPEVMGEGGCLNREESGDANPYGPGSDDLAVAWGGGRLSAADAEKFSRLAADNLVTAKVRVRSAQELADGIAAGGVGVGSDNQGFTMTRDADGFCRPSGSWSHYQVRSGVRVTPGGRKGFDYNQSWGDNVPDGPLLPGCPNNCFGVEWDVQDRLCKNDEWDVLFGFDLWDLEQGGIDLPWVF